MPDPNGETITRQSLTGDIGLVANQSGRVSPFIRFGRSYRHPNLEEMFFAGPATAGSIVPNVNVRPETGNNFDTGAKFMAGRISGGAYFFVNQYDDFIAQDLVVATTPTGPLAQTTNYADVRIAGLEFQVDAPILIGRGVLALTASGAFTRGTITDGVNPLDGESLDDTPADNITPSRVIAGARYTEPQSRWWAEYSIRAQGEVDRVAQTLLDSPFLIAQDIYSLQGFAVQRIGWGFNLRRGRDRLGLTFAVENLTNKVLPRTVPVRPGPRPQLHRGRERRGILEGSGIRDQESGIGSRKSDNRQITRSPVRKSRIDRQFTRSRDHHLLQCFTL